MPAGKGIEEQRRLEPERRAESDVRYALSAAGVDPVKSREGLMDVKHVDRVDEDRALLLGVTTPGIIRIRSIDGTDRLVGYTPPTPANHRLAAVIGFQAATAVSTGAQLYLRYDGDIGSGTDNHALNVGMRLSF